MHALTRWFIHNPVAANLIMLLILIGGVFALSSMRIEGFPKIPADTITIETSFYNAYTSQVDQQITQKIESALVGLHGVQKIQSISMDGLSQVHVQKREGADLERLLSDIRTRLDGVSNLPKDSDRPIISRNDFDLPALIVQLYGSTDVRSLQLVGRGLREELLAQPEISKLNTWGERKQEFRIEVLPETLEKYNLTIYDIVEKINQSSLTLKSGTLKTKGGYIAIRVDSQAYQHMDFASIPIIQTGPGDQVLLSDLSQITDGYEDNDIIVRFNGQAALGMEVLIGRKENLLHIADAVKRTVEAFQPKLPDNIKLDIWADSSHYISERLNLLQTNAFQGLALVFILLAIFLNLKLAFWVAMGIPISLAGAIAVMAGSWVDYSLNDITTFGLIIALGILVDDAVVVGESVFEERKRTQDPLEGTAIGVQRVATATIYGVLTTVAAFFPMLLIDNALGKVLASFSGVVILTLLFSLFESKFILPSHLARISLIDSSRFRLGRYWSNSQNYCQSKLEHFNQHTFKPALEWSLKQRYAVLIIFISFATLGLGLIATGKIETIFFPEIPGQIITINIEMDNHTPIRLTLEHTDKIEMAAAELNQEFIQQYGLNENPIKHILIVVNGPFSVTVYAELLATGQRANLATLDILNQWRTRVGNLESATELSFNATEETGGGFSLQVFSKDEQSLTLASQELVGYLKNVNGISNVRDELKSGKPELYLKLKPEAKNLGFSSETLASQITFRFAGAEAQRLQRDMQEVKVIVKDHSDSKNTIADLIHTRVKSDQGHWYPLSAVAMIESGYITDYIARRNGKRVNTIRASVDKKTVSPTEVAQAVFTLQVPGLLKRYPLVTIQAAGELEETGNIQTGLINSLIFTCLLIYALLAIPLKSYWQPFIIMSVIPFAFIGASMGHLIMNMPLSLLSFFGMLALAGVAVNDSLVMMTRYNQREAEGASQQEALLSAGLDRFKAIFLTSITTAAGLLPLLSETSEQAQYLIPAAISLAFGVMFATSITLILIPVLIMISSDARAWFFSLFKKITT